MNSDIDDLDEDEQLRLALAMSLEQGTVQAVDDDIQILHNVESEAAKSPIKVDLTDDDSKKWQKGPSETSKNGAFPKQQSNSQHSSSSLQSFDRKAMEMERLARLAAKKLGEKRSISDTHSTSQLYGTRQETQAGIQSSKRPRIGEKSPKRTAHHIETIDVDRISASRTKSPSKPTSSRSTNSSQTPVIDLSSSPEISTRGLPINPKHQEPKETSMSSSQSDGIQFPQGVVKRTWAFRHPRKNDIKIEEVFQKHTLRSAIISSFQWDIEWLLNKLRPDTKIELVMQAKEKETQDQYRRETENMRNILLSFPPMPGQVNCMHSKLMLLFHLHHLRIVIPTANLVPYDWGETSQMENSVFLIDLPRLPRGSSQKLTPFGEELLYFLEKQNLREAVRSGVQNFDFSNTENLAFVHTTGGSYFGDEMRRTGHAGLGKAVRELGLQTNESLELDVISSSIGSLNSSFLSTIYYAAQGVKLVNLGKNEIAPKLYDKLRVYFPSDETVRSSTGGPSNAGTICIQKKWWESSEFPRRIFYDYKSTRQGILSHNKIFFARGLNREAKPVAWAYVGSANLSESAWGKLVTDRSRKELKINCRNWECGVLIRVPPERLECNESVERDPDDLDDPDPNETGATVPGLDVFEGVVDMPMQIPSEPIGTKEPWYFME